MARRTDEIVDGGTSVMALVTGPLLGPEPVEA